MSDKKISQLTAATTPLAGTEVLPIVQSSTTDQVSVANLTAGRSVSAGSLTLTTSPLAATSGGTGQNSAFTTNGIPYATSTTALTTGSALTFDGTNLSVNSAGAFVNAKSTVGGYNLHSGHDSGGLRWSIGQMGGAGDYVAFFTGASITEVGRFD